MAPRGAGGASAKPDEDPSSDCRYGGSTGAAGMRRAEGDGVAVSETRVEPRVVEGAREVLELEGAAVIQLKNRIDSNFEAAVQALVKVRGQVLTLRVGKSGLVAKKIAATLTSTGTPA